MTKEDITTDNWSFPNLKLDAAGPLINFYFTVINVQFWFYHLKFFLNTVEPHYIKTRVYSKRQTLDSCLRFLQINNMYKRILQNDSHVHGLHETA